MSTQLKTVFFGTHQFAVSILQSLINNPQISLELVITQPDKPVGRKKVLTPSPVKVLAEQHGIPVETPKGLKKYQLPEELDLGITAQYGLMIREHILDAPRHGILNVHTSLLPKYRGASPIQTALMHGETVTGVTIMKMDIGMDTGPILLQKQLDILPDETYLELDARLAEIGAAALAEAIPGYTDGTLQPQAQDDSLATPCSLLSREDGKVDWNSSANEIYNRYRGLTPWPGIWTTWNDTTLKLLSVKPSNASLKPGEVAWQDKQLLIGCGDGSLEILELQLAGSKAMDAASFVNGNNDFTHEILV